MEIARADPQTPLKTAFHRAIGAKRFRTGLRTEAEAFAAKPGAADELTGRLFYILADIDTDNLDTAGIATARAALNGFYEAGMKLGAKIQSQESLA